MGFVGREFVYDFECAVARRVTRCRVGVSGRRSSQYGQRVDGSTAGSRDTTLIR